MEQYVTVSTSYPPIPINPKLPTMLLTLFLFSLARSVGLRDSAAHMPASEEAGGK